MTTDAATVNAPPRPSHRRLGFGGPGLTRGLVVGYLSVMVLLPVAAVAATSLEGGVAAFWDAVTAPQAVAALKLTVISSFIVVAINVVFGTAIAWVLVRDQFPGKRFVNALVDLPFALPTIVAGLVLLALYGENGVLGIEGISFTRVGVVMALLFVTLPFVIRSVQPVLLELDTDMEEAAASLGARPLTIFRRVVLPNLAPAIVAGAALAFARADRGVRLAGADLGEYPVRDRGLVRLHLRPDRVRQHRERRRGLSGPAADLGRRALSDQPTWTLDLPPWPLAAMAAPWPALGRLQSRAWRRPRSPE